MSVFVLLIAMAVGEVPAGGRASANDGPKALVATAERYLGYPYVYGGDSGSYGFDCSGFTQAVFREHGYELPRSAHLQARVGRPVGWDAIEPGDLLFFSKKPGSRQIMHVAIVVDQSSMIHASSGRREVVIDSLELGFYKERRLMVRRILGESLAPRVAVAPEAATGTSGGEPAAEEAPEPAPLAALTAVPRPGVWHRGPVPLRRAASAVGLAAGAALTPNGALLFVAPQLSLRHEGLDVEGTVQAPFAAYVDPLQPAWSYTRAADFLRLLDSLRIGEPEGDLYVEVSRTLSLTLGNGVLVDGLSPASTAPGLPGLPEHAAPGGAVRIATGGFEAQLVADDVVAPALLGVLVGVGRGLRLRGHGAVDPTAPSASRERARGAGALELWVPVLDRQPFLVTVDASAAAASTRVPALGAEAGSWIKLRHKAVECSLRLALRIHDPGFATGLFGVGYRALRRVGPNGAPLWDELDAVAGVAPWRWGFTVGGHLTVTRRLSVRLVYSDGARLKERGPHLPAQSLELGILGRDFHLPWMGWLVSAYLAYHQRLASRFDLLAERNRRELLFAGLRLASPRHFALELQLAKRPTAVASAVEGFLVLSAELPL